MINLLEIGDKIYVSNKDPNNSGRKGIIKSFGEVDKDILIIEDENPSSYGSRVLFVTHKDYVVSDRDLEDLEIYYLMR